jgi:protein arginine N-methyltransferase 5
MDNLESHTYEVFEKDPVKYTEYQNAMLKAITDRIPIDQIKDKTM